MAKKLKDFEFPQRGRRSKYPWDEWMDGSTWELVAGEDFTAAPATVRALAGKVAAKNGKRVQTAMKGDNVVLQFFDNGEE